MFGPFTSQKGWFAKDFSTSLRNPLSGIKCYKYFRKRYVTESNGKNAKQNLLRVVKDFEKEVCVSVVNACIILVVTYLVTAKVFITNR